MKHIMQKLILSGLTILLTNNIFSQNPIIQDQFTADPSARIFDGKVYLYPSHDILAPKDKPLRKDWFCMEDYHVFSSPDLTEWSNHGVIVSQDKVDWVKPDSYSLWAPDCIYKNGKYYFFFPAPAKDTIHGKGFSIGVAVADNPAGPFIPEPEPVKGVQGIDPCPFIDKDGQAYLYWAARNILVAKLKDNMTELASEPVIIANLPDKGLKEGPFTFERNGMYYLTYPHVQNKTECLEYAMGNSPMGPFNVTGVIMDESPSGCWTNHQSFINFKDQWYLFYHDNDLSPKFDKNRSARIDSMFFNADGTIQKVVPTLRGVGLTDASKQIQIDRYSRISDNGITIAFNDTLNTFNGWKTIFNVPNAWIQYNSVDFGKEKFKSVEIKAKSVNGGTIQIRLNKIDGPVVAEVFIPKENDWKTIDARVTDLQKGVKNLIIVSKGSPVEIDWIRFKK
jgi:GH43 family beta-xylosidase